MRRISGEATVPSADVAGRVLLATTVDLKSNGIGALFLRDLMASQSDFGFLVHVEPPFLMGGGAAASSPSPVRLLRATSSHLPGFHSVRLCWFRQFLLGKRTAAIASATDKAQAECIWVTASSVEMIWIGEQLAALGRDVRVTVWDSPEYLAKNLRLPLALRAAIGKSFSHLLRKARAVSVIGRAMQRDYLQRYGVASEIIRHGIATDHDLSERGHGMYGPIRIVFAGSLYSKKEWNSFTEALEAADWRIGGRPVLLHFMGRFPLSGANKPGEVVFLGEKPFDEALRIMAAMDIGYLPYWFDRSHELVARTSFPGKLSAYAATGLAVFHHAPSYTEATAFLAHYPFGLACPSLKAGEIIHALGRLVTLAATKECRAARQAALRDELSREAMASRFRRFLASA